MGNCPSSQYGSQCATQPNLIDADNDIAGPGVYYGIIVSSYFIFFITSIIWLFDTYKESDPNEKERILSLKFRKVMQSLLITLSDQALFTSIALLATTYFRFCQTSIYHAYIVLDLILVSIAIHACSLMVLSNYFHANPEIKWLRAFIISCVYIWWFVLNVQLIRAGASTEDLAWSIACFRGARYPIPQAQQARNILPLQIAAIVIIAAAICTLSTRLREIIDNYSWAYYLRFLLCYIGPFSCICVGTVNLGYDRNRLLICSNSNAVDASSCVGWNHQNTVFLRQGENEWGFGQFLAIILYGLSLTTLVEFYFDPGEGAEKQPPNALSRHSTQKQSSAV